MSILKGADLIDFTGRHEGFRRIDGFGEEFTKIVRKPDSPQCFVIIDEAIGTEGGEPLLVKDHLNLTGSNPLIGPNDPCGERFPVIQGIYVDDCLPEMKRTVVAGLKTRYKPTEQDKQLVRTFGADSYCYHLVPAMLVAAHNRRKVLGVLVPEGAKLTAQVLDQITKLTR